MVDNQIKCTCEVCGAVKIFGNDEEINFKHIVLSISWATKKETVDVRNKALHVCEDCYLEAATMISDAECSKNKYLFAKFFRKLFKK